MASSVAAILSDGLRRLLQAWVLRREAMLVMVFVSCEGRLIDRRSLELLLQNSKA